MRLFISSDVHGYYDLWMKALEKAGFQKDNPNHAIAVLGDLLDRGSQPKECIDFVNSLPDDRKILIRGNHEDLMEDMLKKGYSTKIDVHNGTIFTVYDYFKIKADDDDLNTVLERFENDEGWKKYINSCVDYWENDKVVLVHGWIPADIKSSGTKMGDFLRDYYNPKYKFKEDWKEGDWCEARWYNGMDLWDQGVVIPNKTIWCGHWHTSWGHSKLHADGVEWLDKIETYYIDPKTKKQEPHINYNPFIDVGIVAMDGCAAVSKQVNVKAITIRKDDIK